MRGWKRTLVCVLVAGVAVAILVHECEAQMMYVPEPECPNEKFLFRHFCSHCRNENDALVYSNWRVRLGLGSPVINTVFTLQTDFATVRTDPNKCRNTRPSVMWQCNMTAQHCELMASSCFYNHSVWNGHFFPEDLECGDTYGHIWRLRSHHSAEEIAEGESGYEEWKRQRSEKER